MKKFLAIMLVIAIVAAFAACGSSDTPEESTTDPTAESTEVNPTDGDITGGYTVKDDITPAELPEDVKEAFDAALADYVGMALTPVAYFGSQVVAGTNYAVLCVGKAVTPDAKAALKVAVIYKDLDGKASVLRVNDFNLSDYTSAEEEDAQTAPAEGGEDGAALMAAAPSEDGAALIAPAPEEASEEGNIAGGWTLNTEYPEAVLTEEEKAACAVFEGVMGAHHEPVACLATQVVAGINYAMLVKTTVPAAEDSVKLNVITIYAGVDGSFDVLNTKTVDLAAIAG